jgi:hypothetical protein
MATLKPESGIGDLVGMDHTATSDHARQELRALISAAVAEADDRRRKALLVMADHWLLVLHGRGEAL